MDRHLTVPNDEARDRLDERRFGGDAPAVRTEAQRDRDRILYSSALLRLGHVTQVAAPEVGHIFHSRLTHSLKVAQVARRLAERLKALRDSLDAAPQALVDALDVDAAEAAALAHDLGHPPFGHLAEEELQRRSAEYGSFEGNPQSFRIVTRLALRDIETPGLNLTRRTLNGLLKYPWPRDTESEDRMAKWGAYESDREYFDWVRQDTFRDERTLEAELMDWADDVTYAVHDMDDFYRAGLIPLDRLGDGGDELLRFERYLQAKRPDDAGQLVEAADRVLTGVLTMRSRYHGTSDERANLRMLGSQLITRYMEAVTLASEDEMVVRFTVDQLRHDEVAVLKELTWYYIIERPSLATIQRGHREVIDALFTMYMDAAQADPQELRVFPPAFAERIATAETTPARGRVVIDLISSMTEQSALATYRQGIGVSPGSLLASSTGPS